MLIGADTAHHREVTGQTSRLIRFPDGIRRLIRLTNWQWEVFDQWPTKTGWYRERLPEQALQIARILEVDYGSGTFEHDVRAALINLLNLSKVDCCSLPLEASNENTCESNP